MCIVKKLFIEKKFTSEIFEIISASMNVTDGVASTAGSSITC